MVQENNCVIFGTVRYSYQIKNMFQNTFAIFGPNDNYNKINIPHNYYLILENIWCSTSVLAYILF